MIRTIQALTIIGAWAGAFTMSYTGAAQDFGVWLAAVAVTLLIVFANFILWAQKFADQRTASNLYRWLSGRSIMGEKAERLVQSLMFGSSGEWRDPITDPPTKDDANDEGLVWVESFRGVQRYMAVSVVEKNVDYVKRWREATEAGSFAADGYSVGGTIKPAKEAEPTHVVTDVDEKAGTITVEAIAEDPDRWRDPVTEPPTEDDGDSLGMIEGKSTYGYPYVSSWVHMIGHMKGDPTGVRWRPLTSVRKAQAEGQNAPTMGQIASELGWREKAVLGDPGMLHSFGLIKSLVDDHGLIRCNENQGVFERTAKGDMVLKMIGRRENQSEQQLRKQFLEE